MARTVQHIHGVLQNIRNGIERFEGIISQLMGLTKIFQLRPEVVPSGSRQKPRDSLSFA